MRPGRAAGAGREQTRKGGCRIELPMRQPPFAVVQAASNARWISGAARSRSAADLIRTSRSPVPR